jgi:hypothetical protein
MVLLFSHRHRNPSPQPPSKSIFSAAIEIHLFGFHRHPLLQSNYSETTLFMVL